VESEIVPITESYNKVGLFPVNVHWHAGAEHYSAGEFDCLDHDKCGPYTMLVVTITIPVVKSMFCQRNILVI